MNIERVHWSRRCGYDHGNYLVPLCAASTVYAELSVWTAEAYHLRNLTYHWRHFPSVFCGEGLDTEYVKTGAARVEAIFQVSTATPSAAAYLDTIFWSRFSRHQRHAHETDSDIVGKVLLKSFDSPAVSAMQALLLETKSRLENSSRRCHIKRVLRCIPSSWSTAAIHLVSSTMLLREW